jgi:hypothetical protein
MRLLPCQRLLEFCPAARLCFTFSCAAQCTVVIQRSEKIVEKEIPPLVLVIIFVPLEPDDAFIILSWVALHLSVEHKQSKGVQFAY